jgi:hypothetical protein
VLLRFALYLCSTLIAALSEASSGFLSVSLFSLFPFEIILNMLLFSSLFEMLVFCLELFSSSFLIASFLSIVFLQVLLSVLFCSPVLRSNEG